MRTLPILGVIMAAVTTLTASAGVTPIDTKLTVTGLAFPVFATHAPNDTSRLFVIEKQGRIRIVDISTATPTLLPTSFLDIDALITGGTSTGSEQGLLGLAFHPNYATNGYFFVNYTNLSGSTVIARYSVDPANPNRALTTGALILLTVVQPFTNHNGGWIGFGPDGYLYIGMGDGGSANDPSNRAQTIVGQKLGKILRIIPNVAGTSPTYTSPTTNPFYGAITGDDEIWAYGLRNPWRPSFDRVTGDFYIADVGQDAVEEVNFQAAGAAGGRNYGWRCTEGTSCTGLTGCTCGSVALTAPVRTYTHSTSGGYSITGGYCYRGCAMPGMQGIYFYADYVSGNIWSFKMVGGAVTEWTLRNTELSTAVGGEVVNTISSFGEDGNGEIYICKQGSGGTTGQIFKIIPAAGEVICVPPNPYDLNDDGAVDGADLGMLMAAWGVPGIGDVNGDGTTDGADLAAMLGAFGS